MSFSDNFHITRTGPAEINSNQLPHWVFLHGLMGAGANWRKVTAQLEETAQVLTFDQRGHGRSFHPDKGYAPENYADDLHELSKEFGWNKFILVGHSIGARNALAFAHKYPERLLCLILEDMGPDLSQNDLSYYKQLLDAIPTPFENRQQARDFFDKQLLKIFEIQGDNPAVIAQFLYSNLIEISTGQLDWRFSRKGIIETVQSSRARDCWNELTQLRIPTLIVRGERSHLLSPETFQKMISCNSLFRGIEIADCGHWIHSERPKEFLQAIQSFAQNFL